MQTRPLIVGIAGSSGAGKGFTTQKIIDYLGDTNCLVISSDNFYFARSEPMEVRAKLNFDLPNMIEFSLLAQLIQELKQGKPIECPIYDFKTHTRTGSNTLLPKPIIIVEGILVLHAPELASELELKFFIDTHPDVCRQRRLERDVKERGRALEDAIRQFDTQVAAADKDFVRPSAQHASVIIENNSSDHTVDISRAVHMINHKRTMTLPYRAGFSQPLFVEKVFGEQTELSSLPGEVYALGTMTPNGFV